MQNFGSYLLWSLAACSLWHGSLAMSLRPGYIFLLDDPSPSQSNSSCLNCLNTELRTLLNQDVKGPDQGYTPGSDNEIKAKLDRLEVKIESQLQAVESKLELQLQAVQTKVEETQAKLEGNLLAIQTRLETFLNKIENSVSNKTDNLEPAAKKEINDLDKNITIPSGFERIGTRYFRIVHDLEDFNTAEERCREMGAYLASFQNEEEFTAVTEKLQKDAYYWIGIHNRDTDGHYVSVASQKPAPFLKWKEGQPNDSEEANCILLRNDEMFDYYCYTFWNFICQADNEI